MPPGSLFPGFIKVAYGRAQVPHVMILPVNTINVDIGDPISSTITAWDDSERDWVDMVTDLITEIADAYSTAVTFERASLFNIPNEGDIPQPIVSADLSIDGTVAVPGWDQATMLQFNAKDEAFNIAKLVLLDFASGGLFTKTTVLTGSGLEAIWGQWASNANGWSSRHNRRPAFFISATRKLNDVLRDNQHLA